MHLEHFGYWIGGGTVLLALASGCLYGGPGVGNRPADFGEVGMIATQTTSGVLFRPPVQQSASPRASLPTSIAIARVQGDSAWRYGEISETWRYADPRDGAQPTDEQLARVDSLSNINDAFVVEPHALRASDDLINSLRRAAAHSGAGLLMLYTFESSSEDTGGIPPLDLVTLGTLPDKVVTVTTRCHAVLIDSQTGYIYAHARSDDDAWQLSNHWTDREAAKQSLRRAEQRAFDRMMDEFDAMWSALRSRYGL